MSNLFSQLRTDPYIVWLGAVGVLGGAVALAGLPETATNALAGFCIGAGSYAALSEVLR